MCPKINIGKAQDLAQQMQQKTTKFVKEAGQVVSEKSVEIAQQTGQVVQKEMQSAQQNLKEGALELRRKILNPVFEEDLKNPQFIIPKIIHIVESDKRQNDVVCQGSIGWIDNKKGMDVLHLYYDNLNLTELNFGPVILYDYLYYIDLNRSNSYIELSNYFGEMQKSKFAELEQIAYKLGAKKYTIEIQEYAKEMYSLKKQESVGLKIKKGFNPSVSNSSETIHRNLSEVKIAAEGVFDTSCEPCRPELMWYRNDKQVESLIAMRCSDKENHKITSRQLSFDSKTTSTISIDTATKIDAVIKDMGFKSIFSMQSEAEEESRKILIFNIDF